MAVCKLCGMPITWANTVNGKKLPLDPDPHVNGTVFLYGTEATVLGRADLKQARKEGTPLHVPHWKTCLAPKEVIAAIRKPS